jgi:chromate transporter
VAPAPSNPAQTILQLAGFFLRLGLTAFGGPAAHLSLMQREVVQRYGWLSRGEFLDLLGAVNLIPGPTSTEMAIFIGYRRGGWLGLVVGGACFILPAALLVSAFAWGYVRFGTLPAANALLYGIKPVIIGIISQALWNLAGAALKSRWLAGVGLAAAASSFVGLDPLLVLLVSALLATVRRFFQAAGDGAPGGMGAGAMIALPATGMVAPGVQFALWPLFLFFLKVGSVLFGSGYLLLAFLRRDLVERWHWLTETQLLDAIAVGQFTPGPLFTTATFIGYILGGPLAALVATVGIFLPSFALVALSGPLIPRLRRSPVAATLLDGVNAGAVALMAVVTWQLGRAALVDWITALVAVASLVVLVKWRINTVWLVLAGAAVGLVKGVLLPDT